MRDACFFCGLGFRHGVTPELTAVGPLLSASFPELVANYSLADILDKRNERPTTTARLVSADMGLDTPPVHLLNASYTLDCKLGGILVDTSSAAG